MGQPVRGRARIDGARPLTIIDGDMNEVPARAAIAAASPRAGHPMARAIEAAELLDVQVDELSRLLTLIAAHRFRRIERLEPAQPGPRQPARHGRARQPQPGGDGRRRQAQLASHPDDHRDDTIRQAAGAAGRRACAVAKRRAPARPEPCNPFAHGPHRHTEGRRHLGGTLSGADTRDDLHSTVDGETGILMRVVHPWGSSAVVWRLLPKPTSGEQPTETSQLDAGVNAKAEGECIHRRDYHHRRRSRKERVPGA